MPWRAGLPYPCWRGKGGVAAAHFDKCPKIVPENLRIGKETS
jgi:hypothetical protein